LGIGLAPKLIQTGLNAVDHRTIIGVVSVVVDVDRREQGPLLGGRVANARSTRAAGIKWHQVRNRTLACCRRSSYYLRGVGTANMRRTEPESIIVSARNNSASNVRAEEEII
jgi:hypothetical protein